MAIKYLFYGLLAIFITIAFIPTIFYCVFKPFDLLINFLRKTFHVFWQKQFELIDKIDDRFYE